LRPALLPPRRPPRSTRTSHPAQYVLPFLAEPAISNAETRRDPQPSSQLAATAPVKVVPAPVSEKKKASMKTLRSAKVRHADRATPTPVHSRPQHRQVVRPDSSLAAGRIDVTSVSPNIVALIEGRAEAWSARELASLIGCTGKHIYALAKSGRMPHLRIGGMVRFDPATTAEWLKKRYVAA
jgi:excisionase family DNA binding protein